MEQDKSHFTTLHWAKMIIIYMLNSSIKVKVESAFQPSCPSGPIPGFHSMKQLARSTSNSPPPSPSLPGWDGSYITGAHLYIPGWREAL